MFSEYEHMKNHYAIVDKLSSPTNALYTDDDFMWVATEKIHGCNFSFIYDGVKITPCRRTSTLKDEDKFFNHLYITNKYKNDIIKIYEYLKTINPQIEQIQVYGELFGGRYKNKTNKNFACIQNGMNYYPEHEYMFYDIKITENNNKRYINKNDLMDMTKIIDIEMKLVPIIHVGNLKSVMELNPKFETQVPSHYNLEPMQNNYAEGFVVHALTERAGENRTIFKFKNPDFAEVITGNKKQKPVKFSTKVSNYLTDHRFENVYSKLLETERTEEIIIQKLLEDIKLEVPEEEFYENAAKGAITRYVKNKLLTYISESEVTKGIDLIEFLNSILDEPIDEVKKFRMTRENIKTKRIPEEIINKFSNDEKKIHDITIVKEEMHLQNFIKYLLDKSNKDPDEPNIYELVFDSKIKLFRISKSKKIKMCCCKKHSIDECVCGMQEFVAQTEQFNYVSYGRWKKTFNFENTDNLFNYVLGENEHKTKYKFVEIPSEYYMLYIDLDFKLYAEIDESLKDEIINFIIQEIKNHIENIDTSYIYSDKNIGSGVHLYFPKLIVNTGIHKQFLNYLKNKLKENYPNYCNILDTVAFNGLQLMFQDNEYYKINFDKTAICIDDKSQLNQLKLTKIRTNATCPTVKFIESV